MYRSKLYYWMALLDDGATYLVLIYTVQKPVTCILKLWTLCLHKIGSRLGNVWNRWYRTYKIKLVKMDCIHKFQNSSTGSDPVNRKSPTQYLRNWLSSHDYNNDTLCQITSVVKKNLEFLYTMFKSMFDLHLFFYFFPVICFYLSTFLEISLILP